MPNFLNPNKGYETIHFEAPEFNKEKIPTDWLEKLAELCYVGVGQNEPRETFSTHLKRHIGEDSTYSSKHLLTERLQYVLGVLNGDFLINKKGLNNNYKRAVIEKLKEEIQQCTPGYHDRVEQIIKWLTQPQSLAGYMSSMRQGLVEKTAAQNTNEVHTTNRFFKLAALYGVEAINDKDSYIGISLLTDDEIFEKLQPAFEDNYSYFSMLNYVMDKIKNELELEGYTGKKDLNRASDANGYYTKEYKAFENYFKTLNFLIWQSGKKPILPYTHEPLLLKETIPGTEEEDQDKDDYKAVVDINWVAVKKELVMRVYLEGYFQLNETQEKEKKELLSEIEQRKNNPEALLTYLNEKKLLADVTTPNKEQHLCYGAPLYDLSLEEKPLNLEGIKNTRWSQYYLNEKTSKELFNYHGQLEIGLGDKELNQEDTAFVLEMMFSKPQELDDFLTFFKLEPVQLFKRLNQEMIDKAGDKIAAMNGAERVLLYRSRANISVLVQLIGTKKSNYLDLRQSIGTNQYQNRKKLTDQINLLSEEDALYLLKEKNNDNRSFFELLLFRHDDQSIHALLARCSHNKRVDFLKEQNTYIFLRSLLTRNPVSIENIKTWIDFFSEDFSSRQKIGQNLWMAVLRKELKILNVLLSLLPEGQRWDYLMMDSAQLLLSSDDVAPEKNLLDILFDMLESGVEQKKQVAIKEYTEIIALLITTCPKVDLLNFLTKKPTIKKVINNLIEFQGFDVLIRIFDLCAERKNLPKKEVSKWNQFKVTLFNACKRRLRIESDDALLSKKSLNLLDSFEKNAASDEEKVKIKQLKESAIKAGILNDSYPVDDQHSNSGMKI